jgi:DNA-binding response OmpR family regulator
MKKIRILAVDDNVVNLRSLVQELQGRYEVIPMNSGSRALRYLQRDTADLILLDVQMPDMDGIETLREIRDRGRGVMIPVIFLTSSNDKTTVMEGMKLGIVDYIVKPFQREDLLNRIDRTLKKQGVVPVEKWELNKSIKELAELIHISQWKQATLKAKEISGYKINEEIAGRVRTVYLKLEAGDYKAAEQTMNRVVQLMNAQNAATTGGRRSSQKLGQLEWSMKLHEVLEELDKFQTQGAIDKLNELMDYEIPADRRKCCEDVMACLKDYDDAEAEKILIHLLEEATR